MKITTYIYRTIAFAGLLLSGLLPLCAQQTSYYCDFEDEQQRKDWSVWGTDAEIDSKDAQRKNCDNKWYIGEIGNFSENGHYGLYISSDNGNTSSYVVKKSAAVAYCELNLSVGTYFLDFDWRALGKNTASVSIFWVPENSSAWQYVHSVPQNNYSTDLNTYLKRDKIYGSITWQSMRCTFDVVAGGEKGGLVFMWDCRQTDNSVPNLPAACIDNISITPCTKCTGEECEAPSFPKDNKGNIIAYDKNTATLSWNGNAGLYQVRDYNMEDGKVVFYDSVASKSVQLKTFTEGYHVFSVRALCYKDKFSEWVSISEFIWIPGNRCIDYMDLDAAKCYYGSFDHVTDGKNTKKGAIDYGYQDIRSHHTLHFVHGETDPRTQGLLQTVPDGEFVSVRLGNWLDDQEIDGIGTGEAIEYEYKVTANGGDIMELQYAVVMEKPGHNNGTDPHFLLEILSDGKQIGGSDSACYSADFAASSDNPESLKGWNEWIPTDKDQDEIEGVGMGTDATIIWKPWTRINISLRPYIGKTLTIRFTTKDCRQAAHWAYAYFTIGCRSGELEGIPCGDFHTTHFEAPEGFNYHWYKVAKPDSTISTANNHNPYVFGDNGSMLYIGEEDTCIYAVEVISKMGNQCSYTLIANPNPRFPVAEIDTVSLKENCTNKMKFINTSHIYFINRKDPSVITPSKDPVENVIYDFGDGFPLTSSVADTVSHEYPVTGGTFTASVTASMSKDDGTCDSTLVFTFTLPDLSASNDTTVNVCNKDSFLLPLTNEYVKKDTTYIYSLGNKNKFGCDQRRMYVRFYDELRDTISVNICEGESYEFYGKVYTDTGLYTETLSGNAHECDTLHTLNLKVNPLLLVHVQDTVSLCADDDYLTIPYLHQQGQLDSIVVRMDSLGIAAGFDSVYLFRPETEIRIPLPANLTPQYYPMTLVFGSKQCPLEPIRVVARVRYAASVIKEKNDLLALLGADHNGGYSWIGYQWYCDSMPVLGAETFYIVVSDENINHEYYCLLTREDGTTIATCPITYLGGRTPIDNTTALSVYPTFVAPYGTIHIEGENAIAFVDVLGNRVASYRSQETHWTVPAPAQSGLYFVLNNQQIIARIIVH